MTTTMPMSSVLTDLETLQEWPAGRVIFREGEQPRGVYLLHSGEVDLVFSARNGFAKPLRIAEPGQILGLSSVVSQKTHEYSATTRMPCTIGFVERELFLDHVDHSPAVWFSVLQLLSEDVNACYDCMRSITAAR